MRKSQEFALQAAKEITIAALQGCDGQIPNQCGDLTAKYFEEVYAAIFALADEDKSGT